MRSRRTTLVIGSSAIILGAALLYGGAAARIFIGNCANQSSNGDCVVWVSTNALEGLGLALVATGFVALMILVKLRARIEIITALASMVLAAWLFHWLRVCEDHLSPDACVSLPNSGACPNTFIICHPGLASYAALTLPLAVVIGVIILRRLKP